LITSISNKAISELSGALPCKSGLFLFIVEIKQAGK